MLTDTGLLNPFVPSNSRPWSKKLVTHLLNRTMFGAKVSDVNSVLSLTPDEAVELLFQNLSLPAPPGTWVTELPTNNNILNNTRMKELRLWWLKQMYLQPVSFKEKMVLFWHNHFTSEANVVKVPQFMYIQNTLFRSNTFGNFKDLTKMVTRDPAMLFYLDGIKNTANRPNENYSRELVELFTIGIGNYTETDVQEGARALTGWIINGLTSEFIPSRHDNGQKTYLGQTGNFDDDDVVNIIFTKPETAVFFCNKLYRNFINQKEDMSYAMPVINELADLLRNNNYELMPVLKTLFKSQLFFSENIIGSIIKSPIDTMMGAVKQMNIALNLSSTSNRDLNYINTEAADAGQQALNPPNVRGWIGYRDWINTNSLPTRNSFCESIVTGIKKDLTPTGYSVDPVPFAMTFPFPNDAVKLVNDISEHLVRITFSPKQKDQLLLTLLDGSAVYDWNINDPEASSRLKKFLKALIYLAEYQLT
ncbi:MAG: DUF1800 domain-containing protein [Bacteroidota bacterium]|nr:DUF1800 domain-containing protein [Bacteroidota bacterium]